MPISLKSIVTKLNDTTRKALEDAAGLCLARTHYNVEIEHFLVKLLDVPDSDFSRILKQFGVDKPRLATELSRSLDKLKTGNARTPAFSPSLFRMLTEAWSIGSLEFGSAQIRSGFTTLALVSDDELSRIVRDIGKELQKIEPDALKKALPAILDDSPEMRPSRQRQQARGTPGAARPGRWQDAEPRSVHRQPDRERQDRQDRSGAGPRLRDPPDHRHPDAAPPEQPDPYR